MAYMGLALEEEESYWLEKELADRVEYRDEDLVLTGNEKIGSFFGSFFSVLDSEKAR